MCIENAEEESRSSIVTKSVGEGPRRKNRQGGREQHMKLGKFPQSGKTCKLEGEG